MYEGYYQLKAKPFTLLPDPGFLYLGAKHKMALSLLEYGLASGSAFIVMTGHPGTGKTTLLNRVLDQSTHRWTIGVLSNTHGGLSGLMPWIAAAFGLETKDKSEVDLFHEFSRFLEREHAAGRRVLLVLDEAQNVGQAMLEELRLLSNLNDGRRRSLQIHLSGQPALREHLKGPGMEQFAQRISVEYALDALAEDDTIAYIGHRVRVAGRRRPLFSTLTCRTVFRLSGGIPRLINQLCDHALVYGYAAQAEMITAGAVLDAACARGQHGVLPFTVSPESIELAQHELDDEQVEVKACLSEKDTVRETPAPGDLPEKSFDASYQEALALKQAGEYVRAVALFDQVARQDNWRAKALAQKGLCYKAIGRYDDAIATIRAALDGSRHSTQERISLQYLLGRTLEAKGRSDEAVRVYRALQQGGRPYRDVASRLARLKSTAYSGRSERVLHPTWFGAFWKECGQLLRGTQG